ncbi:hypothetical protein ACKUEH_25300, partial [Escherichia coli]
MAYVQESIAPEMMGKVFSLLMTAMTLSMPIGLLVAGPVVEVIGVNTWFFGTVAKLAMRQPFVLFKGLTFQKLCL